ncbi:MAG TPA: sodium-independent anion transporter, partial [Porphyromonadaceae bacterium]|nr:sodium-independent anion transporter [Porphyromonadaceae bacterium]
DVIVLFITFTLSMIFDLSVAVEVGIVMACFLFMSRMMKSTDIKLLSHDIDENKENGEDSSLFIDKLNVPDGVEVYEINGPMFFGMGNRFEEVMNSISSKKPYVRILLMNKVPFIDATGLGNLFTMCQMSKTSGVRIILSGVNTNVFETIKKAPTVYNLVEEHFICKDIHQALEVAEEVKNNFVELGWRK